MMNIVQILELIGASSGIISLILYFPLRSRQINANTESTTVKTLEGVVSGLSKEIDSKEERIEKLEKQSKDMEAQIHLLNKSNMINDIAFGAVEKCSLRDKCPIIAKKKELEKGQ